MVLFYSPGDKQGSDRDPQHPQQCCREVQLQVTGNPQAPADQDPLNKINGRDMAAAKAEQPEKPVGPDLPRNPVKHRKPAKDKADMKQGIGRPCAVKREPVFGNHGRGK